MKAWRDREWISFQINDRRTKSKTDTWEVWSLDGARHLGQVRWFSHWRRYSFFPGPGTVFEQHCLMRIVKFMVEETAAHRKGRRAFRRESA